jgi:hypothetical protein
LVKGWIKRAFVTKMQQYAGVQPATINNAEESKLRISFDPENFTREQVVAIVTAVFDSHGYNPKSTRQQGVRFGARGAVTPFEQGPVKYVDMDMQSPGPGSDSKGWKYRAVINDRNVELMVFTQTPPRPFLGMTLDSEPTSWQPPSMKQVLKELQKRLSTTAAKRNSQSATIQGNNNDEAGLPSANNDQGETSGRKQEPSYNVPVPAYLKPSEENAWRTAVQRGTVDAFAAFAKNYPHSPHIKASRGTLRGRYWQKIQLGSDTVSEEGVIVTVKNTSLLVNISVEEAVRLGAVAARPAIPEEDAKATGTTFNYLFLEVTNGGCLLAVKAKDGSTRKMMIEPRDNEDSVIVTNADGTRLLAWDINKAQVSSHPDPNPTFIAAASAMPPFNDLSLGGTLQIGGGYNLPIGNSVNNR